MGDAKENSLKIESFIERLFNKPPEPIDSSMSLKDKIVITLYTKVAKIKIENVDEATS